MDYMFRTDKGLARATPNKNDVDLTSKSSLRLTDIERTDRDKIPLVLTSRLQFYDFSIGGILYPIREALEMTGIEEEDRNIDSYRGTLADNLENIGVLTYRHNLSNFKKVDLDSPEILEREEGLVGIILGGNNPEGPVPCVGLLLPTHERLRNLGYQTHYI